VTPSSEIKVSRDAFAGVLRKVDPLRALAVAGTAIACYLLLTHGLRVPENLSLLHGFWGVAIGVAGIMLSLSIGRPGRSCLLICWLCLWFTAGFAELRSSAITDGLVLGGIVPYSDANNFLREASMVIEGRNLSEWGSRRPLADAYLSGQLFLSGDHLAAALFLMGIFSAVAVGLAVGEIRNAMGFVAAALWGWLMLVYCRRYIGENVSEQAGIAFGAVGAALLMRGFARTLRSCLWSGIFILSLALNARPGALVILPVIVAAVAWRWRHLKAARMAGLGILCVLAAFLFSLFFLKLLGSKQGRLMSNYYECAYGIVFGGGWQKAASDIPGFAQMSDEAKISEIDRRVVAALKTHPSLIWRAAERNWADFFENAKTALGPYSFFRDPDTEYVLLGLSGAGLLLALTMWNPLSPLILAIGAGIILSVPFVPTPDADLMRAYAATMPVMFLVPAFATFGWKDWAERIPSKHGIADRTNANSSSEQARGADWLNWCSVPYLVVMLVLPLAARFVFPVLPAVVLKAEGPRVAATIRLDRAVWIEFVPGSVIRPADPRLISAEQFRTNIFGVFRWFNPKQAEFLDKIARPGVALVCPGSSDAAFLAVDGASFTGSRSEIVVYGRWHQAESSYSPSFVDESVAASYLGK
jgi:hypothetical protein